LTPVLGAPTDRPRRQRASLEPGSKHEEICTRLSSISAAAEAHMGKVVRRSAGGDLNEKHAVAEIVRAKVIADFANIYLIILSKDGLAQDQMLEGAMVAAANRFATRVERCNYLPEGDLILRAEGDAGVHHAWDLHTDFLGSLTAHLDALKRMGVAIKEFPTVFADAQDVLRVGVAATK
jgi:hypothetical protein